MFANDGGTLVFGVDEPSPGHFSAHPIDLAGLPERIQQVATSRLEPPLAIEVSTVSTDADSTRGFVVVRVPASPDAPHMTDGRYFGRAGSTRTALSDAQVRRIISNRGLAANRVEELMDADIARDPIPEPDRHHAHLHLVALPRFGPSDLVMSSVLDSGGNWSTWFHHQLLSGDFHPPLGTRWAPDLGRAATMGSRADGHAIYTHRMGQDRQAQEALVGTPTEISTHEAQLLDLEINEDGTTHLFCGRGSDRLHGDPDERILYPGLVAGMALRVVQVARRITELTGFVGTWDMGMAATGLLGVRAANSNAAFANTTTYSRHHYRSTTSATTAHLVQDERLIAERLVGQLLRGLGLDGRLDTLLPPRT